MTLYEATLVRHSVRAYKAQPLEQSIIDSLENRIENLNAKTGLHIQLITNEPTAFQSPMARYGKFSNVTNYLVMVAKKGPETEQLLGYYGEELVLYAQTLGLNSCWVGLTYNLPKGTADLQEGEKVHCVVALGYGADQGIQHKSRRPEEVSNVTVDSPAWFKRAVDSALTAPTAVNQQKFYFELKTDGEVRATTRFSLIGYTNIDLGIAKQHFDLAINRP